MSAVDQVETLPVDQLEALREKAEQIEGLFAGATKREGSRRLSEGPKATEQRDAWCKALEDAVLDLCNVLPEGTEDYDARKLLEFLLRLRKAIASDPGAADERGEVELAMMMMRDVALRMARRLDHDRLDDPSTAAKAIFGVLRDVGVGDLSRLLGVSTKTVRSWKAGGPVTRNAARVVLIAHLLTYLRSSMTPAGLVMWFDAPRSQLGGASALQLLDERGIAAQEQLLPLARSLRGQLAS